MNSDIRSVWFAMILMCVALWYEIKSGKVKIHNNFQNCYRMNCQNKIPDQKKYRDSPKQQELVVEKRYRHNTPVEDVYIDFDTGLKKGSATLGTAFVVGEKTLLSARHVINGCRKSYVVDSQNNVTPIIKAKIQENTDVALLYVKKPLSSDFFLIDNIDANSNTDGFHFGFPQEKSGQVYSHFLGQAKMLNSKGYNVNENVLVWAIEKGPGKSLSGISGGPVFNQNGALVGVSIAESLRRGRTYSSDPQTNKFIIDANQVVQNKDSAKKIHINLENYENLNKELQNGNMIVKVICII